MAVVPQIALMGKGIDTASIFQNALSNVQGVENLQQSRALAPLQNQLLQTQVDQGQSQADSARLTNKFTSLAFGAVEILPDLEAGNFASVSNKLAARRQQLIQEGKPTETTDEAIQLLQTNPDQLLASTQKVISVAQQQGILKAPGGGVAIRSSAPIVDPETGQLSIPTFNPNTGETKLIPLEGAIQQTPSQKLEAEIAAKTQIATTEAELQGQTAAVKAAVAKGSKIFDRIQPLSLAISNYDEAITAIDAGAETGVVDSFLPSFRKASIELDNVVKRLGLDVVGNTTFGALSESELKFALSAAIPENLQPADLKEWLVAKRDAQKKVKARVEEAASFLSEGTHTIKDWIEIDAARQLNAKNQAESPPTQQGATTDIQALTQEAEAAIAAGADRGAVMQRLQQMTGGQ